jgi:pseudouridine-5'-monophosphatase
MIFPRPIRAVLFDMDGILLDTERIYTEVTQEYVGQWGKTFDWSIKANMVGRPAIDAATYLVEALDLPVAPEDYLRDRESHLLERMADAQPMPGAEELVRALRSAGVPITVATSSNRTFFARKTAHNPWFSLFNAIITGDDERIGRGKPAPDIFLLAADAVGIPAGDCLVVEDSPAGIAAGNAAGAQTLAVPFPGMDHDKLSEADHLIASLTDLSLGDLGL